MAVASLTASMTIYSSPEIDAFKTSAISFSFVTITIFFSVSSFAMTNLGYISIKFDFIESTFSSVYIIFS